jgi:hypothetical protein
MLRYNILFLVLILSTGRTFAQENIDVAPGEDRWTVKTSISNSSKPKKVALEKLLALPLLDEEYSDKNYPDKLIPVKVGGTMKEGDIITKKGYIHLVALEKASGNKRDGDYHIQLTLNPEWSDSCFIVEIPYAEFADGAIKDKCEAARAFIRDEILNGKTPSTRGSIMQGKVYVQVTGQLFYDAIHARTMRNPDPSKRTYRGKRGGQPIPMHSYTAWKIHPVIDIEFAPEPE